MASMQPESGSIILCWMQLPTSFSVPFFQRRQGHTVQNWPGSDLNGLARVWLNSSGLKASWCAGISRPGYWQDATNQLPGSHFQTRFRSSPDILDNNIVQNQPGSDLVLADCARFWTNESGPEESQCARIIRPASGQCFPANPTWMWIGSGMFTGFIIIRIITSLFRHTSDAALPLELFRLDARLTRLLSWVYAMKRYSQRASALTGLDSVITWCQVALRQVLLSSIMLPALYVIQFGLVVRC